MRERKSRSTKSFKKLKARAPIGGWIQTNEQTNEPLDWENVEHFYWFQLGSLFANPWLIETRSEGQKNQEKTSDPCFAWIHILWSFNCTKDQCLKIELSEIELTFINSQIILDSWNWRNSKFQKMLYLIFYLNLTILEWNCCQRKFFNYCINTFNHNMIEKQKKLKIDSESTFWKDRYLRE